MARTCCAPVLNPNVFYSQLAHQLLHTGPDSRETTNYCYTLIVVPYCTAGNKFEHAIQSTNCHHSTGMFTYFFFTPAAFVDGLTAPTPSCRWHLIGSGLIRHVLLTWAAVIAGAGPQTHTVQFVAQTLNLSKNTLLLKQGNWLRAGRPGFDYRQGLGHFSSPPPPDRMRPTHPPIPWVPGLFPRG